MLPIEMKEAIQNGTMKAFVSKHVEVNVGKIFDFIILDNELTITTSMRSYLDISFLGRLEWIAKAECVGVVKFDSTFLVNGIFINERLNYSINLHSAKRLGFDDFREAENYYKTLLGEDLKGYLHLFELVKNGD